MQCGIVARFIAFLLILVVVVVVVSFHLSREALPVCSWFRSTSGIEALPVCSGKI
jgi:uncharacterized membrane protein YphA (DoxX/SURF4 family)